MSLNEHGRTSRAQLLFKPLSHAMWISGWALALPIITVACYLSCDQHAKLGLVVCSSFLHSITCTHSSNQHKFYLSNPRIIRNSLCLLEIAALIFTVMCNLRIPEKSVKSKTPFIHSRKQDIKATGHIHIKMCWRDSSDHMIQLNCDNPFVPSTVAQYNVSLYTEKYCVPGTVKIE